MPLFVFLLLFFFFFEVLFALACSECGSRVCVVREVLVGGSKFVLFAQVRLAFLRGVDSFGGRCALR